MIQKHFPKCSLRIIWIKVLLCAPHARNCTCISIHGSKTIRSKFADPWANQDLPHSDLFSSQSNANLKFLKIFSVSNFLYSLFLSNQCISKHRILSNRICKPLSLTAQVRLPRPIAILFLDYRYVASHLLRLKVPVSSENLTPRPYHFFICSYLSGTIFYNCTVFFGNLSIHRHPYNPFLSSPSLSALMNLSRTIFSAQ